MMGNLSTGSEADSVSSSPIHTRWFSSRSKHWRDVVSCVLESWPRSAIARSIIVIGLFLLFTMPPQCDTALLQYHTLTKKAKACAYNAPASISSVWYVHELSVGLMFDFEPFPLGEGMFVTEHCVDSHCLKAVFAVIRIKAILDSRLIGFGKGLVRTNTIYPKEYSRSITKPAPTGNYPVVVWCRPNPAV